MDHVSESTKAIMREFKSKVHISLGKRMDDDDKKLFVLASSLDVRWKSTDFVLTTVDEFVAAIDDFETRISQKSLTSRVQSQLREVDAAPLEGAQLMKNQFQALFGRILNGSQPHSAVSTESKLREELNVFIALPSLSSKELTSAEQFDVLKWWKDRKSIYPLLSAVAKKLFSILASASSSESPFSTTGNIVTALRSTIAPQNVDMVLFLHANTPSNFDHIEKEGLVR